MEDRGKGHGIYSSALSFWLYINCIRVALEPVWFHKSLQNERKQSDSTIVNALYIQQNEKETKEQEKSHYILER